MNKNTLILAAAVGCAVFAVRAQEIRELTFQTAMPAKVSPKIDGVLDDACWKETTVQSDYYDYLRPNPRRVTCMKTDCRLVYDAKGVYVGICNWERKVEKLKQNVTKNFQGDIWNDDCGELYFDPTASGVGYYKFIVNSLGKYDTAWRMDAANMDENWTAAGIVCAAKVFADRWEVELFVPWTVFHNAPAPKPGDIWMFNHSRFAYAAVWKYATTAPGASGESASKFGFLYFSDGAKPDAQKVLSLLEKRLNSLWGIGIDGKVYVHDLKGTHASDLGAEKASLEKTFVAQEASVRGLIAAAQRKDLQGRLDKLHASFTNELAQYDASFASVKMFRELVSKLEAMSYELKLAALADPAVAAKPIELPLAGKYDLNPPKEYDGHNGWYRHNRIKGALVTPHLDWTPKQLGAVPRPLFMTGMNATIREMVELEQRFAYDDAQFFPGAFGVSSIYEDAVSHYTPLDKQSQFETLLARKPSVIALNGSQFHVIPTHYRYEILRRVRDEGLGLALFGGSVDDALLKKCGRPKEAAAELLGRSPRPPHSSGLEVYTFGKGRIAQIRYWENPGGWSLSWKSQFESRCAFMANMIRWAAGADAAAKVSFTSADGKGKYVFAADAASLDYEIDNAAGAVDRVRVRLRTKDGNVVVKDDTRALAKGKNALKFPLAQVPAGAYVLDLVPAKGAACDFAAVRPFEKVSPIGTVAIGGKENVVVPEGKGLDVPLTWEKPLPANGVVRFEVEDHPYRQLRLKGETSVKAGATSAALPLPAQEFPTLAGLLTATVSAGGKDLARVQRHIFFPNHRFPDYTMIMWEGLWQGGVAELFAPQLIDVMGYENHLGEGGSLSAVFNGRAVPHICRVGLGAGKEGTVWGGAPKPPAKTPDEKAREKKMMADINVLKPAVRKYLEEGFTPRVLKCAPYGVSVYNLGDECFYSDDIGFGDAEAEALYRDWIAKRYGTVARYNAAHGTKIADWSGVVHKKCAQAKKDDDWAGWFDQKSYAAHLYSETFQLMRSIIKKYDPQARVGAEGSSAGNIEETVKNLEFWGPYGDVYMDEVLKSIAPDRVRGQWWGAYVRESRDGFPGRQWEFLLTGRANADQWFSAIIASSEGSHAGDLTLAPYVAKLHDNHMQLKKGLASYMIRTPLRPDGFALYYSRPSSAASTLSDDFKSPGEGGREIIRFCYRTGLEVSFVTPSTLKDLEGRKLVFLPGICALSDAEVAALKAFAAKGGQIWADAEPGILDEFLGKRAEAPLKGLWKKYARGAGDAEYAKILAGIGVVQRERVTGVAPETLILRVRETSDQKAVGFTCLAKDCGKPVTVDFGSKGFVYECDAGYVGETDKVEIKALERPFKLYAQFKAKQSAPALDLPKAVKPGDFVKVSFKPLRKGGVYRLSVKGPDGKVILNRDRVVTVDGRVDALDLQFPFTDAGAYAVSLRDIATGLETVRPVTVR